MKVDLGRAERDPAGSRESLNRPEIDLEEE